MSEQNTTNDLINSEGIDDRFNGKFNDLGINLSVRDFFGIIYDIIKRIEEGKQNIYQIEFIDCEFHFDNENGAQIGRTLERSIKFTNCTFRNEVIWGQAVFAKVIGEYKESFIFENCIFENNIQFYDFGLGGFMHQYNMNPIISFICCRLKHINIHNMRGSISNLILRIEKCPNNSNGDSADMVSISNVKGLTMEIFLSRLKNLKISEVSEKFEILSNHSEIDRMRIDNSKITSRLDIYDNCDYHFEKVFFEKEVNLGENNEHKKKIKVKQWTQKKIEAISCIFNETVTLSKCNRNSVLMHDTNFKKKIWLDNASVDNLEFINCKFEDTVKIFNFENVIKSANFETSTINGLFIFNGWSGKKMTLEKDANINFSNIYLGTEGYLIIRNINDTNNQNGNFKFNCANILGVVVINNIYAKSLDLEYCSIVGSFDAEKIKIKEYKNSQTLTKLKNEAKKKSDTIKALEYRALEMRKYRKELKWHSKDQFLLCLNTISNCNGTNWLVGIGFTIVVAAFFAFLINHFGIDYNERLSFTWCWNRDSITNMLDRLFPVLNIFSFESNNDDIIVSKFPKLTTCGKYLFLFSKIFVGYGIYQTIAAFRKYGK